MYRRFRNMTRDKILNTAARAPVMPTPRKKRAALAASSPNAEQIKQAESTDNIYGIPLLAAKLILANCLFWILAAVIVLIRQLPPLHFLMAMFVVVVGLMLWLGLQWLISKAFWWFVVIYSSAISIGLIVLFASRVMDAIDRVPSLPTAR